MELISQLSVVMVLLSLSVCCSGAARRKPHLSMDQAEKIALNRHSGHVKSSVLEREHGRVIYSFDIEAGDMVREVNVDANTGKIVEDRLESVSDQASEQRKETKPPHKHLP